MANILKMGSNRKSSKPRNLWVQGGFLMFSINIKWSCDGCGTLQEAPFKKWAPLTMEATETKLKIGNQSCIGINVLKEWQYLTVKSPWKCWETVLSLYHFELFERSPMVRQPRAWTGVTWTSVRMPTNGALDRYRWNDNKWIHELQMMAFEVRAKAVKIKVSVASPLKLLDDLSRCLPPMWR